LGSTLLLIEKATHDPLYLWVIRELTMNLSEGLGKPEEHEDGQNHRRSAVDIVVVEGDFVTYRASRLDFLGRGRS
jgi:hypothetical protein